MNSDTEMQDDYEPSSEVPTQRRYTTRQRAATVFRDISGSDSPPRSQEHAELVAQLEGILGRSTVSASLWACMQICDLQMLRSLIAAFEICPASIEPIEEYCTFLPLIWMQSRVVGSRKTTASSESSNSSSTRDASYIEQAKKRDKEKCVLTNTIYPQGAHIFPHCEIRPRTPRLPNIWNTLKMFFTPQQLEKWQSSLRANLEHPDQLGDSCVNIISLSPSAHTLWQRGCFALRPVSISSDEKELRIEFFWLPKVNHGRFDKVEISTQPPVIRPGATQSAEGVALFRLAPAFGSDDERIRSGDIFTLCTEDPQNYPLPSFKLLEMQWHLNRIVWLSGASDALDEYEQSDDDGYEGIETAGMDRPLEWLASTDSSNYEDNSGHGEISSSPSSMYPSPIKTRESMQATETTTTSAQAILTHTQSDE